MQWGSILLIKETSVKIKLVFFHFRRKKNLMVRWHGLTYMRLGKVSYYLVGSAVARNRPRCFLKMEQCFLVIALAISKFCYAALLLLVFNFIYCEVSIRGWNVQNIHSLKNHYKIKQLCDHYQSEHRTEPSSLGNATSHHSLAVLLEGKHYSLLLPFMRIFLPFFFFYCVTTTQVCSLQQCSVLFACL